MSKIAFITTREPQVAFGQVGLEIMAALLKQRGHEVIGLCDSIFDSSPRITRDERKNLEIVKDFEPDFVGFSVLTFRYQWNLKFARLVKDILPDAKVIFGGSHPTAVPEVVSKESCVDYICVGEGEGAMLDLVKEPERKDIPNIYPNPLRPLIQDLDSLPFPDKSIWLGTAVNKDAFQTWLCLTSRGCPHRCSFCFNSTLQDIYKNLGKYVRYRSVENVIQELVLAKQNYPVRFVMFMDDNFTLKSEWLNRFTEIYGKRINLPYACNTHPLLMDDERAKWLKDSGCKSVIIGLQSGSEYVRKNIVGRHESNEQVKRVADVCHKNKLSFSYDHMFGLPGGDDIEFMRETVLLHNETRPFTVNTYRMYVLPGTPIMKQLDLSEETIHKIEQGTHQEATIRALRDPHYISYRNLFVFLPILPKWVVRKIVNSESLLSKVGAMPEAAIWLAKAINNITGDNTWLVKAYIKSIPRIFVQKLRGYRGEFEVPSARGDDDN